ncbi:PREDICTED: carbohydrate sulfotransferase 11-like [Priapulus caudatus]|uniref:Carbohydrate sulfotransferase n=1 Tax=Priapulus caudatus TaxID=37621 RepID=A0ABM1EVX9_PRICU|nr:PREDICTED: carbohydrate sulfotransferase 11-like [Priapulus caudatus]
MISIFQVQSRLLPDEINRLEREQTKRKRRVHRACAANLTHASAKGALGKAENFNYYKKVIVDDEHKLLYCNVQKIASTNWKRVLIALRYHPPKDPATINKSLVHRKGGNWTYLAAFNAKERQYRLDNYFKFLFVRNPYERLLSAYMNKFVEQNPLFQQTYVPLIARMYRGGNNATGGAIARNETVTFGEFLRI